ncbi:TIGR02996 domain-containing protein [Gemmata sp. JC673]|uniref:TIGR02996 domain-containing protein n=1 Tax=Gemmata algarum TaxID=2975278 RepID=A0ABU5F672_9BACT|nr:TIGR02996 domain-containing protein [Gemmata algarum]MDY3562846.1 TIGR02996 domain-containing protein [Gemmata algarum]
MSHAAFLSAITDSPDDDTVRLVYADFLDEQGSPGEKDRAEFIRMQVRLATLSETAPERPALEDRENELLRKYERVWIGPLHDRLARGLARWRFERGFLTTVQVTAAALANRGAALFEAHPVSRVRLLEIGTGSERSLVRARWWSHVRDLDTGRTAPTFARLEALLRAPHLTRLRALGFDTSGENGPNPILPDLLATSPATANLEELHVRDRRRDPAELLPFLNGSRVRLLKLSQNTLTQEGLRALLTSPFAAGDVRVHLEGPRLGPELWPAFTTKKARPVVERIGFGTRTQPAALDLSTLLSSPAAANLTALDLGETKLSGAAIRELATTDFLARATELRLTRCYVGVKGMAALAAAPAPNLRKLALGETELKARGVFKLCDAPWADGLTELDLMRNAVDDDALADMAGSGRFTNLRHLDLRVNSPDLEGCTIAIGDRGVMALAAAPNLARLRSLNLYRTRVTARGVEALLNSPHLRLAGLELGGYDLGSDLPAVLARAPALARLTALSLSFTPSLGGDALLPLAESPHLSPLCRLDVRYCHVSDRVAAALAARLGRRLENHPTVETW